MSTPVDAVASAPDAFQSNPWAWFDASSASDPVARRARDFVEGMLPADLTSSAGLDRGLLASLLTRGITDLGISGAQTLQYEMSQETAGARPGQSLAALLSKLGPGFEKLGQFLANRPDLIASVYREDLKTLSDRASPITSYTVERAIDEMLGAKPDVDGAPLTRNRVFASISPTPLGTGSIGQAHRATLVDGSEVVIKVVKPGVAERLKENFTVIVDVLASGGASAIVDLVKEIQRQSLNETDLRKEAVAIDAGRGHLASSGVVVPRVWHELLAENVMVMDLAPGASIKAGAAVDAGAARDVFKTIASLIVKGDVHGDPHRGNVLLNAVPGGPTRVALIDWGLTVHLDVRQRMLLLLLLEGVRSGSVGTVCRSLRWLGAREQPGVDLAAVVRSHIGGGGPLLTRLESLLLDLQMRRVGVPSPIVGAAKSLLLAEGVARELDPNFDPEVALKSLKLLPTLGRVHKEPVLDLANVLAVARRGSLTEQAAEGDRALQRRVQALAVVPSEAQHVVADSGYMVMIKLHTVRENAVAVADNVLQQLALVQQIVPVDSAALSRLATLGTWAANIFERTMVLDDIARTALFGDGPAVIRPVVMDTLATALTKLPRATLSDTQLQQSRLPQTSAEIEAALMKRYTVKPFDVSYSQTAVQNSSRANVSSALRPIFFASRDITASYEAVYERTAQLQKLAPERDLNVAGARRLLQKSQELELALLGQVKEFAKQGNWSDIVQDRVGELEKHTPRSWLASVFGRADVGAGELNSQHAVLRDIVAEATRLSK